jgi:hypothetical protein
MSVIERFRARGVVNLTRAACWIALAGLAMVAFSILFPRPLPVILAMSVGHVIGVCAFACYLIAVVLDISRTRPPVPPADP